jgi:predicted Zn-ribbon and HTH transcriptional regulator
MSDAETTERVLEVMRDADEPLTAGAIQRRLATRSRDVMTGVVRDACEELIEEGRVESTDESPPAYRPVEE